MVSTGSFTLEEIQEVEGFRVLREPWNGLLVESSDNNIFLTWEWTFTWWRHFGGTHKLNILIVKESGNIVGIAPLMRSNYGKGIFSVSLIENLGAVRGCDYSGIIVDRNKPQVLGIILDYLENILRNSATIIRISNVPEYSDILPSLQKKYPSLSRSVRLIERPISSCPYITLPATWEEYLRPFSKRRRGHIKQKKYHLQKNHAVELEKNQGQEIQAQLDFLFELHRRRWQGSSIGRLFADPEVREFYCDICEAFSHNQWLDLSFLRIDGKRASGTLAFIYNGVFYHHTIAHEPSLSSYSAGTAHMLILIEKGIQSGLKKFDMLKGAEDYKFRYANGRTVCFQVLMAKPSTGGKYRLTLLRALDKLSSIRSRSLHENFNKIIRKFAKMGK